MSKITPQKKPKKLFVDPETYDALKATADAKGQTVSEYVEHLVR